MDSQAQLRVLTFEPKPPDNLVILDNTLPCDGTYRCSCVTCELERIRRVKRGVRPSMPLPLKRRKAA